MKEPKSRTWAGILNDKWISEQASLMNPKTDIRLIGGSVSGDASSGYPESFWRNSSARENYQRLAQRLPKRLAIDFQDVMRRIGEFALQVHPRFDTILAEHAYWEWLLYTEFDDEKYREHIVHPFKVAVVADWLLRETNKTAEIAENLSRSDSLKSILGDWQLSTRVLTKEPDGHHIIRTAVWLAGLFHDMGYAHLLMCSLESHLRRSFSFYMGDIVASSVTGISGNLLKKSLLAKHLNTTVVPGTTGARLAKTRLATPKEPWQLALYENLPLNHSIAGALNLLCLLDELKAVPQRLDPRFAIAFELAAEAVFLHDLTKPYKFRGPNPKLTYFDTPLAVLLILADEIQCWGRPRVHYYWPAENHDEVVMRFENSVVEPLRYLWNEDRTILSLDTRIMDALTHLIEEDRTAPWDGFVKLNRLS